jgi:hypothetical protein
MTTYQKKEKKIQALKNRENKIKEKKLKRV